MLEPGTLTDLLAVQTPKATMKAEEEACGFIGVVMALRGRVIETTWDQVQAIQVCDKQVVRSVLVDHAVNLFQ